MINLLYRTILRFRSMNFLSNQLLAVLFPQLSVFILYVAIGKVDARESGSLALKKDEEKFKITTKQCNSGVFFPNPTQFDCACLTGVWGFYPNYCDKPAMFVGGDRYCFCLEQEMMLTQVAHVGSHRYPFAPSLNYFQEANFIQLVNVISTDNRIPKFMGTTGSFITVTNVPWTLYGDKGESVCLEPCVNGARIFCLFNERLRETLNNAKWNYITKVSQGCHSNFSINSDYCYTIKRENEEDPDSCKVFPNLDSCIHSDCYNNGNTGGSNITVTDIINDPTLADPDCGTIPGWIPKPTTRKPTNDSSEMTEATSVCTSEGPCETTIVPEQESSEAQSRVAKVVNCTDLSRASVKEFWEDPSNNECSKSLVEAVFVNQLQRVAAKRFENVFNSKLKSLEQMTEVVLLSRDIIKKTCGDEYVPEEFFDMATEAFVIFMREDFFYGLDAMDDRGFKRIQKSLTKCWKRATKFAFESKPLDCEVRKITGKLILPGSTKALITIPETAKSKHYEPLIETAWKMLLHAHSYCFEDFQFFNDHHLFSVAFMELFSKTIYDKWIEPLQNKALYSLILPKFELMDEILENMDYCVGALNVVSKCPVWLSRSNPKARSSMSQPKPSAAPPGEARNSTNATAGKNSTSRKKRSVWLTQRDHEREKTSIWNKLGHCVQYMEEPMSSLGLAYCNQVY